LFSCETLIQQFTKEQISKHFDPFSEHRRDVHGSIEFALCSQKERSDIVYVGFDRPGEAEAFVKSCSGLTDFGKGPIPVRLVKEQILPKISRTPRASTYSFRRRAIVDLGRMGELCGYGKGCKARDTWHQSRSSQRRLPCHAVPQSVLWST
jgi:hypothetical protein